MARVLSDYRENFVVHLLLNRHRGGRSFDWIALLPFLVLGLAETVMMAALGPAAVFWILLSFSLSCPIASLLGAWVAERHLSKLQTEGILSELRQLPVPQTALETSLLVTPCATGAAGSLLIHGLIVPTAVLGMAGLGSSLVIAGILPLAWGALRYGLMSAAIRYGVYVGWSTGIESMRRDEAPGSGIVDWFNRQWVPMVAWLLAVVILTMMIGSQISWLRIGGLILGLFVIFPVPISYWFGCSADADRIVQANSAPTPLKSLLE